MSKSKVQKRKANISNNSSVGTVFKATALRVAMNMYTMSTMTVNLMKKSSLMTIFKTIASTPYVAMNKFKKSMMIVNTTTK